MILCMIPLIMLNMAVHMVESTSYVEMQDSAQAAWEDSESV